MTMDLTNLLVPAMMFFALGLFAQLIRSDLKFPPDLIKALTMFSVPTFEVTLPSLITA